MQATLETSAVATELKMVSFHSNPKEGKCQRLFKPYNCTKASKVMIKILQASLCQYTNQKLPNIKIALRRGRGTRDQTANIFWITEKAREC